MHQSDEVFISKEPFAKRICSILDKRQDKQNNYSNYDHRYHRQTRVKIPCVKDNVHKNLNAYLQQKEKTMPINSLNFESEIFSPPKPKNLIATEPYRQAYIFPWKYSYKKVNYQTCTEQFRRVKSSCVDLSKY